jgi:hypothetical protein
MTYKGSCHCGKAAFEVEGDLAEVIDCNCSICERTGSLLWFVPRDALRLSTPEAELSTYTFNKHTIKHRFCPACGIHVFAQASDPSGKPMAAVNVRALQGVDVSALKVKPFDGRSL